MHIGGGLANEVVLGDEPSVAGHGVSPVMVWPGIVLGPVAVLAELSVGAVVSPADTVSSSEPIRRESPKAAASPTTTMMPMRSTRFLVWLRFCSFWQLGQPSLPVGLLSFPLLRTHEGRRLPSGGVGSAAAGAGADPLPR